MKRLIVCCDGTWNTAMQARRARPARARRSATARISFRMGYARFDGTASASDLH